MTSPTRRVAIVVCVALLLVGAGCSGNPATPSATSRQPTSTAGPVGGTTTNTSTSTSTTTGTTSIPTTPSGTWSPNAPAERYPPGVAANGSLTNVSALVDAHVEATANQPVVFTSAVSSPDERRVRRYAHGATPTPYYSTQVRTSNEGQVVTEYYQTGSTGLLQLASDTRTAYTVTQNTSVYSYGWLTDGARGPRRSLETILMTGNYSVNGTVERNSRTFIQLTADEPSPRGTELWTSEYEGTVLVTPEGTIYNVDTSSVVKRDGANESVAVSMMLDTDVTWPGPPSWVTDLPHLSIAIVENGHALEIRNTGGAALPANTTFQVYAKNATQRPIYVAPGGTRGATETITTTARLKPGDAIYVTATTDGTSPSFTLHDEPTRGEYTFGAAKIQRGGTITYSLVTGVNDD